MSEWIVTQTCAVEGRDVEVRIGRPYQLGERVSEGAADGNFESQSAVWIDGIWEPRTILSPMRDAAAR